MRHPELGQRTVEYARQDAKLVSKIAGELGISEAVPAQLNDAG